MKLSLKVITEKLNMNTLMPLAEDADPSLRLSRPVFYTNETLLKRNTLYIAKGNDLAETIDFEKGCGLICIGYPEKTTSPHRLADLLILDEKINILKLANAVNAIYEYYDNWESQLVQIAQQRPFSTAINNLAEVSSSVIGEKITAKADANAFVFENPENVSAGQEALLKYLNDFSLNYVNLFSERANSDNPAFAKLLTLALDTGSISRPQLHAELKKLSWSKDDHYIMASLRPEKADDFLSAAAHFCDEFMMTFESSFAFIYQKSVVALVNLGPSGETEEDFIKELSHLVKAFSFKAGVSNEFKGLSNIRTYHNECVTAYGIGESRNPDEYIYRFYDYSFEYITARAAGELPLDELYSPVYYRLKKYDEQNGSDYLITLKAYLDSGMNALQTAKDMYIHRATIIYRLKRICEIGQTDLTDRKELLHLNLTFAMLENSEKENK